MLAKKYLREVPSGAYWQVIYPDGAHEEYFGKNYNGQSAEEQADIAVDEFNKWQANQIKIGGYKL